ncbi:hypothetical protein BGZ61DRAFT_575186 [Ilyonectria robusta]|uniref:uncharacterized protein n=1 Tax=Ilyonectria robusta TaxID=1079257 RepID=UPI001E8D1D50|nr:uncharacterized protein BGZ61DRAFT_575186 [Ilyonectria robusta]KAH8652866.1 hypothetical protein BGZ61DRAFT_575186 [Ilyonectria robusta]
MDMDIDETTLRLVIELQLQDIESLAVSTKGKQREGQQPDSIRVHAGGSVNNTLGRSRSNSMQSSLSHVDNELFEKMLALSVRDEPGESSQWAASRKQELGQCDVCTEQRTAHLITELPCDHKYCQDCVVRLYTDALTGESLFPPRCCRQPIPIDLAKPLLPPRLVGRFRAKEQELNTPNHTCPNCKATTCVTCKAAAHQGEDCPSDETTQQLPELAQQQSWRQCYSCHRLVELNLGCNHITCKCKAEFCYECGRRWKTCRCEHFREDRLIARADAIIDRDPHAANLTGQPREERRRREMRNLVQNYECYHRNWTYRGGGHQCEECHDWLPNYIFECRQCRIQACNRCRHNRL